MGGLAYDCMIACCEADGFRPRIVQDTPQWPTAIRLIAAGLGVSIAPACVSSLDMPGVVYKRLRSACRTSVDIGVRRDFYSPSRGVSQNHSPAVLGRRLNAGAKHRRSSQLFSPGYHVRRIRSAGDMTWRLGTSGNLFETVLTELQGDEHSATPFRPSRIVRLETVRITNAP